MALRNFLHRKNMPSLDSLTILGLFSVKRQGMRLKKFKIPILVRMTLLITILLGTVAWIIAHKNSHFFANFSKTREETAELLEVKMISSQITTLVEIFSEKAKLFGMDIIAESERETFTPILKSKFNGDSDLLHLEIWKSLDNNPQKLKALTKENDDYQPLEQMNWDLQSIQQAIDGNLLAIQQKIGQSEQKMISSLLVYLPLVRGIGQKYDYIAIAVFKLDKIQKTFAEILSRNVYLADTHGNLMAHSRGEILQKHPNIISWPLFSHAFKSTQSLGQFTENIKNIAGADIQGAFAKNYFNLFIFSETEKEIIMGPSLVAKQESLYWLGLILSISFFLVFLFSTTITNPIEKLQKITQEIASGNFEVSAAKQVNSLDEVGELAIAFDHMTLGLKERDKIKNVMNKFHGSAVADTLINTELEKGGSRKNCVIYFSDIRGFTDFSERHSAEEVVEMLNEYFEIMVGIIIKNGGVVDKFIGDAIMAVWGAPHGSEDDAQKAIKACLEMRVALAAFNDKRISEGKEPIRCGMGLHTGDVISGTIGSSERMEYTVIGDNVNMASRIEASTKAFGTDVLISQDLAQKVKNFFVIKEAGRVEVKGKSEPLILNTIHGYRHQDGTVEIVETAYSSYKAEKADKIKVA
jgi:adenylate cyclase